MASGKTVSNLVVRTVAGEVASVISTRSAERLNLKEGDRVFAIFKAIGVSIEKQ
jgi:molybdopterin-binding protein